MRGAKFIDSLKRKFRVSTDRVLAAHLGVSDPAIQVWKSGRSVTYLQLATLVHKASFQSNIIHPVAEFYPVATPDASVSGARDVFSEMDERSLVHPYRQGHREALEHHHGVYVFYDSRGRAIYVGKARRQSIWKEMNFAFNHPRGDVQTIRRVSHPTRRREYKPAETQRRQITARDVPLHALAAYFSAYSVPDAMIDNLEALLVRSFANDLLNIKMEKFGKKRKKAKRK